MPSKITLGQCTSTTSRACLATTVPFRSPIQMSLFLPFQNGEKVIFTAETVAQWNGTVAAKQALRCLMRDSPWLKTESVISALCACYSRTILRVSHPCTALEDKIISYFYFCLLNKLG